MNVIDNATAQRFELVEQGHQAIADYQLRDGVMTFTHTFVPPSARGTGIASRLIAGALASARDRGLKVVSHCSFVTVYVQRHPEWRDLLA